MRNVTRPVLLVAGLVAAQLLPAAEIDSFTPPLPPTAPWHGASRELMLPPDDAWATPFEASGGQESPGHGETLAWLGRLADASQQVRRVDLGTSLQGRAIAMYVVSAGGAQDPAALRATGLPTVLVHGGIHAGEIDGKDAGMMLLRDLTMAGPLRALLDRVNLLFIPILNVDGHERVSPWGRINQRGPAHTGWRTNARNQNLNRDFAKLDTPEIRALVAAINRWQPDLYVDVHVTDGMDHRYDVTWGYNGPHAWSPSIARWLDERLTPRATKDLSAMGHTPAPLFFPADARDIASGLVEWTAGPRFSNGYGDARHLATVLVENHSLKPFDRRVLGTYVFLRSVLQTVAEHAAGLAAATAADRDGRPGSRFMSWVLPADEEPSLFDLAGIEQRLIPSPTTGGDRVEWTGRPVDLQVPWRVLSQGQDAVAVPRAYLVPAAWGDVIERLRLHGLQMQVLEAERTVPVEMYRLSGVEMAAEPFEGHVRVTAAAQPERREQSFAPGSVRVPLDQPLGLLAMLLLEPASPDSLFQWGFFLEVLQRTEYVEDYIMDPMAERMLEESPELRRAFQQALEDPAFAADPTARRQWFYARTPWFDERWRLYPVGRELAP